MKFLIFNILIFLGSLAPPTKDYDSIHSASGKGYSYEAIFAAPYDDQETLEIRLNHLSWFFEHFKSNLAKLSDLGLFRKKFCDIENKKDEITHLVSHILNDHEDYIILIYQYDKQTFKKDLNNFIDYLHVKDTSMYDSTLIKRLKQYTFSLNKLLSWNRIYGH